MQEKAYVFSTTRENKSEMQTQEYGYSILNEEGLSPVIPGGELGLHSSPVR